MTTATAPLPYRIATFAALWLLMGGIGALMPGCSLVPDKRARERYHNPLPQLHRIAILPFFNQSGEPTLDQTLVAEAYYAELQAIPGFEVLPVGVALQAWQKWEQLRMFGGQLAGGADLQESDGARFQQFARYLGVDAVVVGAVTDFDPYNPPRMALTVRWYAANPAFHPVPVGYGLPWGTDAEREIPSRVVLETELELARAQLKTQSPLAPVAGAATGVAMASAEPLEPQEAQPHGSGLIEGGIYGMEGELAAPLPIGWPDPSMLIPDAPRSDGPPPAMAQHEPVLTHTRIYRGDDPDFTERLADYVDAMDDGRLGGWKSYLTRSDDFIRFCCRLHITEMLEMRGGRDQSDLILRWPISRYWR